MDLKTDAQTAADFARQIALIRVGMEDMAAWMAGARQDLANMEVARDRAYACVAESRIAIERVARERDSYEQRLTASLLLIDRLRVDLAEAEARRAYLRELLDAAVGREPSVAEPIVSERVAQDLHGSENRSPAGVTVGG